MTLTARLTAVIMLAAMLMAPEAAAQAAAHKHSHPHDHSVPGELPTPYPDRITLTWSDDPATTMSVTWRTDPSVTSSLAQISIALAEPSFTSLARTVEATTEPLDLSIIDHEHVKANYHSATFTALEPGTLYAYRVGDGMHWSEWFHARTAENTDVPMSFIYFGDAQNNIRSHWSRAIRAAFSEAPFALFMIHAGDLVSGAHNNVEWGEWHQAGSFIQSMLPNLPVPGNHEYDEFTEAEGDLGIEHLSAHWRPGFTLPLNGAAGFKETTYHLDIQGVRFIGLNTEPATEDAEALAVQTAWLDSLLTHNTNRWTIPIFHHPIFSSGEGRDNPNIRAAWKPLFDEHRVDLVLQGHDHTYARGRTWNVPEGVNVRSPIGGTMYVNSVSGAKMYEVSPGRWENYYGHVQMERGAENTQLFQVIRVEGDTLHFTAYTVTGDVYDAFNLIKGPEGGPNEFVALVDSDVPERTHDNTVPYARADDVGDSVEGVVEDVTEDYLVIGKVRYHYGSHTLYEEGTADSLREGVILELEWVRGEDGRFSATTIEFDDDDLDVMMTHGTLQAADGVDGRTFVLAGGTKVEIVPETQFVGFGGIEEVLGGEQAALVEYVIDEAGDHYVARRVEVRGNGQDRGHGHH